MTADRAPPIGVYDSKFGKEADQETDIHGYSIPTYLSHPMI